MSIFITARVLPTPLYPLALRGWHSLDTRASAGSRGVRGDSRAGQHAAAERRQSTASIGHLLSRGIPARAAKPPTRRSGGGHGLLMLLLPRRLLLRPLLVLGKLAKAMRRRGDIQVVARAFVPLVFRHRPRQRTPGDRMPPLPELAQLPATAAAVASRRWRPRARPRQPPRDSRRVAAAATAPDDVAREEAAMPASVGNVVLGIRHRTVSPAGGGRATAPAAGKEVPATRTPPAHNAPRDTRVADNDVPAERGGAGFDKPRGERGSSRASGRTTFAAPAVETAKGPRRVAYHRTRLSVSGSRGYANPPRDVSNNGLEFLKLLPNAIMDPLPARDVLGVVIGQLIRHTINLRHRSTVAQFDDPDACSALVRGQPNEVTWGTVVGRREEKIKRAGEWSLGGGSPLPAAPHGSRDLQAVGVEGGAWQRARECLEQGPSFSTGHVSHPGGGAPTSRGDNAALGVHSNEGPTEPPEAVAAIVVGRPIWVNSPLEATRSVSGWNNPFKRLEGWGGEERCEREKGRERGWQ